MEPGAIVNISDNSSEFYCRNGEVLEVNESNVVVMFLVRETERVTGISCIVELFKQKQLYEMKEGRLQVLRGL